MTSPTDDFQLGPWRVQAGLHRLGRNGETVQLEPKVAEVLAHLAARPGQVVSRDELQEAVWGSPYVSEDLPRRAIYELRKVLGDDPRRPEYIETIPRAGYRLIAPVVPAQVVRAPGEAPAAPAAAAAPATHPRVRYAWTAAVAVLATAALAFAVSRSSRTAESGAPRITPLTAHPGLEYDPAFSPDGSRVAYLRAPSSAVDGEVALHVQLVGAESSLVVSEEPAGFDDPIESPAWSPDGTSIAYLRWRPGEGWGIYQVPALGGAERKVLGLPGAGVAGLAWSPDGRCLALGLRHRRDEPYAIHRVPLDTLEPERLTRPPAAVEGDRNPAYSPDGETLAFLRNVAVDAHEVHVVGSDGGGSRRLLPEAHKIADVDWSADGRELVLAIHDAGRHRLWSVDVASGATRRLPHLGDNARWVTVARRGELLAASRTRFDFGVWRFDLATGEGAALPALSSTFYDQGLDLSPDGRRVAFASTRSGDYEIWVTDLDGRRPLRLTSFEGPNTGHPRWSADGRRVVFHSNREGHFDLWTADVDGGAPRRLTEHPADERAPSFSRDGGALYFASNRTGNWQVWKMPAAGGEADQVTRNGGYFARESTDGRWLYVTRWQVDGLWRVALDGGLEEQVLGEELRSWEWGNWTPSPEGTYYVTRDASGGPFLALAPPEGGEARRVVSFGSTPVQPSLALSPDGGFFLVAQLERVESDVVLVEGYRARSPPLRRR